MPRRNANHCQLPLSPYALDAASRTNASRSQRIAITDFLEEISRKEIDGSHRLTEIYQDGIWDMIRYALPECEDERHEARLGIVPGAPGHRVIHRILPELAAVSGDAPLCLSLFAGTVCVPVIAELSTSQPVGKRLLNPAQYAMF